MAIIEKSPANGVARKQDRVRVPMSAPQQKLAVAAIPGYFMYWMKGTPERLSQAIKGGYEFVDEKEIDGLTNGLIGGDAKVSGNSDMGTRVSVIAGDEVDAQNQPIRLYLMKIKEEWHLEDLQAQEKQNDGLRAALQAGRVGAEQDNAADSGTRYIDKARTGTNMFTPKPLRRT